MNTITKVVLVNPEDDAVGVMEKLEAHQKGLLHRAFSIMLYRNNPKTSEIEVLLQQRASSKYHGGGLWANTCCSHPEWQEPVIKGAYRRIQQEIFLHQPELLNSLKLSYAGFFIYRAELDQGLIEHELDHVFVGEYLGEIPDFNRDEIENMEWVLLKQLEKELFERLSLNKKYAPWLEKVCEKVNLFLKK